MKLFFGQYKGKNLSEVPIHYILWLYTTYKKNPRVSLKGEHSSISDELFLECGKKLRAAGYNTKGLWPKKIV